MPTLIVSVTIATTRLCSGCRSNPNTFGKPKQRVDMSALRLYHFVMGRGKRRAGSVGAIVSVSDNPDRFRPGVPISIEPEEAPKSSLGVPPIGMSIPAHVMTGSQAHETYFDALLWFEQASDYELYDLNQADYGGSEAHQVAQWFGMSTANIKEIMGHSDTEGGFSCQIFLEEAEEWIRQHRPIILHEETEPCDRCNVLVLAGDGRAWPDDISSQERLCDTCFDEADIPGIDVQKPDR